MGSHFIRVPPRRAPDVAPEMQRHAVRSASPAGDDRYFEGLEKGEFDKVRVLSARLCSRTPDTL